MATQTHAVDVASAHDLDARRQAYDLMSRALAVLDDASVDPIAAAHLQSAIELIDLPKLQLAPQHLSHPLASEVLEQLLTTESNSLPAMIDLLGVPAYITDAEGNVTHWNHECIMFAGRQPQLGSDKWCVTWKLFTIAGDPLPHDHCPMAVAIKEQRAIRGEIAIAERPDGRRVAFRPYPTPIFDHDGSLMGAVNMLIDISKEQQTELHTQADSCRRIAASTTDADGKATLHRIAEGLEAQAAGFCRR